MADATINKKSWGYQAITGTDATDVTTAIVKLNMLEVMGTAGAETVTIADAKGNAIMLITVTTANQSQLYDLRSQRFDGLNVTLSAGTVRANFFVE